MISFQKQHPHPALQPYVKAYWYLRVCNEPSFAPLPLPCAPIPEQCLYFYPKEKPKAIRADGMVMEGKGGMILGQGTSRTNVYIPRNYLMFKVIFQPGGFYRLFGLPMTLFTDRAEEASEALGIGMKEVCEKVESTEDFQTMVQATEHFFLKTLKHGTIDAHPLDKVMQHLPWHTSSMDVLARTSCLSLRQFERKFLERLGVSPKYYSRIVRFNEALKMKLARPRESWLGIAYDNGYHDHMHLLRDFKTFTGEVPSSFELDRALIY